MIEKVLVNMIENDAAGVGAFIGTGPATRVYPEVAEQGVNKPYMVYHRVNAQRFNHMAGPGGLCRTVIQFDCVAFKTSDIMGLADAARLLLDGVANITFDGSTITGTMLSNEVDTDQSQSPTDASDLRARSRLLDLTVWYKEAIT